MKRLCRDRGLPVVEYIGREPRTTSTPERSRASFRFPMFVKPANLGSSVGISKAHDCAELKAALKLAAQYDRKILVERGIEGREFECARAGQSTIPKPPCPARSCLRASFTITKTSTS